MNGTLNVYLGYENRTHGGGEEELAWQILLQSHPKHV